MESQKIISLLLNNNDIESQTFSTKKGILSMIKIMDNMVKGIKIILLLNVRLK